MSEDLVERDRCKDEFLADLGHELRNPLAPLRNAVQVLRMKFARDQEIDQAGAMMERQLSHLVRLVDDLLDVSRITRGTFELRKERLDLAALVARAAESVRPLLDERKHHLEIRPPTADLGLEADPARLEQVLVQPPHECGEVYAVRRADCRRPPGAQATRRWSGCADNGIGIRPEVISHIFDLFQQADRVPGHVSAGLGVGLSLVRRLVEMHGGTVTASSPGPNQGSEFVIRLPALPDPAVASFALSSAAPSPTADGTTGQAVARRRRPPGGRFAF